MRDSETLRLLAALAGEAGDASQALIEATRLAGSAIGCEVRLVASDGVHFQVYPSIDDGNIFSMSFEAAMLRSREVRKVAGPTVYALGDDGLPAAFAPADGRAAGAQLALALWCGDALAGCVVAQGPWAPEAALRAGRFLELAGPALAIVLQRVVDADRTQRIRQQMEALSSIARVFSDAKDMESVLQDVANAINAATGFLATIDVVDTLGRTTMRSAAASRFANTPLSDLWVKMTQAPDNVKALVLAQREPVILPDLLHDPRISEEARAFYSRATVVSGATFPLMMQEKVIGLLRYGSLKPTAFPPATLSLLQELAVQTAMVVYAVQLHLERKKLEDQLRYQAFHDSLTGLENRARFTERLERQLARALRTGKPAAVIFLDLDNFKSINDGYGHPVGDRLLVEVSRRINECLGAEDGCARLGGDEFAILLEDLAGVEHTIYVAGLLMDALKEPFSCGGDDVVVTASVGIAISGEMPATADELLRKADVAMYAAKRQGKARFQVYEPELLRLRPAA